MKWPCRPHERPLTWPMIRRLRRKLLADGQTLGQNLHFCPLIVAQSASHGRHRRLSCATKPCFIFPGQQCPNPPPCKTSPLRRDAPRAPNASPQSRTSGNAALGLCRQRPRSRRRKGSLAFGRSPGPHGRGCVRDLDPRLSHRSRAEAPPSPAPLGRKKGAASHENRAFSRFLGRLTYFTKRSLAVICAGFSRPRRSRQVTAMSESLPSGRIVRRSASLAT